MGKKKTTASKMADNIYDQIKDRIHKDFLKCAGRTNEMMFQEANAMYRTLIEEFYDYETTSYKRHFEGKPGTRHGENLTYANKIKKGYKHTPILHMELSAEGMSNNPPYEYHTPAEVLNCVTSGVRFMLPGTPQGMMTIDLTEMEYHGKYFHFSGGTINDAFEKFRQDWGTISREAFYSIWGEYTKNWKLT